MMLMLMLQARGWVGDSPLSDLRRNMFGKTYVLATQTNSPSCREPVLIS